MKLRKDGTGRKPAHRFGLRAPHLTPPRAVFCVGPFTTGMVFAPTLDDLDAAFASVARSLRNTKL